jgi:putative transposase
MVAPDRDRDYWATNDLKMTALTRIRFTGYAWSIETDHRGIKQYCGIERVQSDPRRPCAT